MSLVSNINISISCVSSRLYFIPRISKGKEKPLYTPALSSGSCPSGQRNRMMMLASVPGSGPRAGLCSGPSWGPHSRSGPAPPRLHHGELAQGPCKVPSLSTTSQPSAWQLRSRLSRHTNHNAVS